MRIEEIPAKPKEQKIIRVAAYARVSSDKDAAFHSLEAQTEYYRDYVAAHPEWELVSIYSDNGISGTTINRPEFQAENRGHRSPDVSGINMGERRSAASYNCRVLSSTAIYLDPGLLPGSSHLLGTAGQADCPSHGVAPDRVYSTPMFPWGGCALTAPFHPYLPVRKAVSFCCTCPRVTPGGRYPLSLPCGARTFLMAALSGSPRDRLSCLPNYFTGTEPPCQ